MSDILICPRIIWKVDLSVLNSSSKTYCHSIHILKSLWKFVIELDEDWDEYKIYIMPENAEVYLNMCFFVQCGVRDIYGTCRFEVSQTMSTKNLLNCYVWGAARSLVLEENLIQNNVLLVTLAVEPESNWYDCQSLSDSMTPGNSCTSTPCTEDMISNLKYLLKNALHYDVTLECEEESIKAHKSILSCRSSVFEAMFRGDTKEALEGKVVIHDTSFHILEKVIHYIYTTEVIFEDLNVAFKIYAEADKYIIPSLKERCQMFFKTYLCASCSKSELDSRVSYAYRILCVADEHSDIPLQCWVKNYLADSVLLITPEWNKFAETNTNVALEIYFRFLKKVKFGRSHFLEVSNL